MTLNAKIGGFMDLLTISNGDTSLYHSQGGATVLYYVYFGMTVIEASYFIPNSRVVRFRCIVCAIIYYLVHFWCTGFGETACIGLDYSVICDSLFDGAATSRIDLQRPVVNANERLNRL